MNKEPNWAPCYLQELSLDGKKLATSKSEKITYSVESNYQVSIVSLHPHAERHFFKSGSKSTY